MLKRFGFTSLLIISVFTAVTSAQDFSFARPRPLMALCAELQNKYGLLVTYEDAPTDLIWETGSEIHPDGVKFLFPKWKPITFHIQPALPTRSNAAAQMNAATDPDQSFAAVQDLVNQYNLSGNPGRFSVTQDKGYLHIQQTSRIVNGQWQAFTPVSDAILSMESKLASCQQVLDDFYTAMREQHNIAIAEANIPGGALLRHHCELTGASVTARQVLEAVIDGLDSNNLTGEKTLAYSWDLVHDPNWDKYFLSLSLVRRHSPSPAAEPTTPQTIATGANPGSNLRVKHQKASIAAQQP